ncbi:MAG: hypothetical protein J0M20_13855 [Burkholderiales bacterium]|nr:hypothetical protein [Burkholderiales bacterium]
MRPILTLLVLASAVLLAGCDQLGIESAAVVAEKRSAEGKAIGGACRHAARAIEDCYTLNKKADKAAVYAGWRDMDDYMRENKLEPVLPQIKPEPKKKPPPAEGEEAVADAAADGKDSKAEDDGHGPAKAAGGKH